MDSRTAAHALTQIAAYLELRGEARFRSRAYEQAAGALVTLDTDDLAALDQDGTLAETRGIWPATLAVVRDLITTGESRYLEQLRASVPPRLLEPGDLRGVLQCHSTYSDGKATIAEMAAAARQRGWSYLGITDHSQAAFYGGLKRDRVLAQHDEIDGLNAMAGDFRLLKGIEADILADGALDYDDELLDQFDFVVGSVHSRFTMDQPTMTARVLRALERSS